MTNSLLHAVPRTGRFIAVLFGCMSLQVLQANAAGNADVFPDRPIKIVMPAPAGGTADVIGRLIGKELSEILKTPVIIDNRPGASGLIGTQVVQTAEPDGSTLLFTAVSLHVTANLLKKVSPFDPVKDFTPLARVVRYPLYIVANPALPANNLRELTAYAKQKPNEIGYASPGNGTLGNLACELYAIAAGVKFLHIPYKGTTHTASAVLANEAQFMCDTIAGSRAFIEAGRMKGLALMADKRASQAPSIPTTSESGYPGLEAYVWLGFLAPAKTPPAITSKLVDALHAAMKAPAVLAQLDRAAMEPLNDTPSAFTAAIKADEAAWAKVIKEKGIKGD